MKAFLEKLFDTTNELSLLLLEAGNYAEESKDEALIAFINREINGYTSNDTLPDYRKINAEIVVDITNVYGQLAYKQEKIDFSKLSENLEIDLEESKLYEGIAFIENYIKSINKRYGNQAIS